MNDLDHILMTDDPSVGFHVSHISGNFCCRQSASQVVTPSSSTVGGVRFPLHTLPYSPNQRFELPENTAVTGETLHSKYLPPVLFTSQQHSENKCETPWGSRQAFSILT